MSTPVIGVTGSIGTGKSTFAELLTEEEGEHLDADEIAKQLMLPGEKAHKRVVEEFGRSILDEDGFVSFDLLADEVFVDEDKLDKLESILHPLVNERLRDRLSREDSDFYVIEAPLLFEAGGDEICDWVVVVTADESKVKNRMKERSFSPDEIERRRSRQLPESEKVQRADEVVENNGALEELRDKAEDLLTSIQSRSLDKR